jgi:mono/diheme cytochrome c family protein/glucose/arabinose dehydrogenase
MSMRLAYRPAAVSTAAAVVLSVSFALSAQTPAPAGQAPASAAGAATPQGGQRGPVRNPNEGADFTPKPPVQPRSPEEEAKSFYLPPGYRLELVAAEPQIISPAVIEFDGNGRMYVAEFVSYMLDADGTGAHDPISRITRFESTKGDGKYDKRTVFADKLILPRMILPLQDGVILTNETDSDDVVRLTDTDGDGVADKREVVYSGVGIGRDGNLEHEQNGFVWGLDNWIYSTYNAFRFRWTPNGFLREPTAGNGAQWGVSQDDDGKIWWACGGCETGYVNFEIPIQYGALPRLADQTEAGFETVWPIAGVSDTQGGMGRVRVPLGVLNHFTAGAGIDVVRGDRLPADLLGDVLVGEPVGRLIRRAKVVKTEGLTQLRNAYPGSEFILSSDLFFRPINLKTAPDGMVYIADMYHGIIQDSQWTLPGSYLRQRIDQYKLDKVTNLGRIWRLRYDGVPAVPATPAQPNSGATPGSPAIPGIAPNFAPPRMYGETAAQLAGHLTHANGWWRDTAQRLLILKQDMSVVPALRQMARASESLTGRFHALWTIEGLGALDATLVRGLMQDANPRMRVQAIRASETLYKAGNKSLAADYRTLTKDGDPDVAIQAMLTLNVFKAPDIAEVVTAAQSASKARGVTEIGNWIVRPPAGRGGGGGRVLTPEQQDLMDRGGAIFNEICFTCHGPDGRGAPLAGADAGVTMAPPLSGSPRVQGHRDFVIKTLLHGLTGPVNGVTYTQVMVPMGTNKDEWVAAIASYIRNSFGNTASFIAPADVARVRAATPARKAGWTVAEIQSTLPTLLLVQPGWKVTASHNPAIAAGALTLAGWTSAAPQQAGMWLQIELPAPVSLAEIQFDTPAAGRGFGIGSLGGGDGRAMNSTAAQAGGGGGNRGGAPQAPPPGLFPRAYTVQVSLDGAKWSAPVAQGAGAGGQTIISFKPVQAKFVRITETASDPATVAWTLLNLRLYGAGK